MCRREQKSFQSDGDTLVGVGVVLRTTNPPDIKEHTPAAAALAPFRGKEIANDKNNKASKHSQTSTFYWKSIFFI